jgi:cell division septum initiation protein DivIVA
MTKDYEIVPKKELEELKKEIRLLKQEIKNYSGAEQEIPGSKSLQESIEELISVFREAVNELKNPSQVKEYRETYELPLKVLIEQNEKIAKGILALADILNEHLPQIKENTQQVRARYIRIPVQMPNQAYQGQQQIQQRNQTGAQFQYYQPQVQTPQVAQQPQSITAPSQNFGPQTQHMTPQQPGQTFNMQIPIPPQSQSQEIKPKPLPKHELKF